MRILAALAGKKTYLTLALGALTVLGNKGGIHVPGVTLNPDNWLSDMFTMLAAAFMRAGVAKIGA